MRAGELRKRVQIQAPSDARDAHGGNVRSWSTLDTVWASIEPLTGRELLEAQQVESRATVRICIRHYAGLDTTHRIVFTE